MMKKTTLFSLLVPAALLVGCHERSAVNGLTVEMLDCPLGVAAEHPRLSWRIESALPATVQTGYRILVSTDPGDLETGENLIWDSATFSPPTKPCPVSIVTPTFRQPVS